MRGHHMLNIQLDDQITPRLRELLNAELPAARARMTSELLLDTLQRTRDRNPVRTGRSRAGWDTAQAEVTTIDSTTTTEKQGTNTVPYIACLEYGTSRMRPVAMLRRALAEVRQHIAKFFRLS